MCYTTKRPHWTLAEEHRKEIFSPVFQADIQIWTCGTSNMKISAVSIKSCIFALLSRYKSAIVKIDVPMSVNFTTQTFFEIFDGARFFETKSVVCAMFGAPFYRRSFFLLNFLRFLRYLRLAVVVVLLIKYTINYCGI